MTLKRLGFSVSTVYRQRKPGLFHYAKHQLSFIVASLSIFAFVAGNMLGQHGWYAFWRTVLGNNDDAAIMFVGTVPPIDKVPDYAEWAKYGGSKHVGTYNQIPSQVLRSLPYYDQTELTNGTASALAKQTYSTLWAGGYDGPNGSHAGVDIDAPRGTPVQSIANGIVEKMSLGTTGFGHYVLIRHPNVPDSTKPGGTTTLYSTYAHMDVVMVSVGEVVHKGQTIGTVGNTGLVFGATGYHLYFEVDTAEAPYHPYWPFTSTEASNAGLTYVQAVNSTLFQNRLYEYTLNPMAFVQQYVSYTPTVTVATRPSAPAKPRLTGAALLKQTTADRLKNRMAQAETRGTLVTQALSSQTAVSSSVPAAVVVAEPAPTPVPVPEPTPVVVTELSSDIQVAEAESTPLAPIVKGSNTDVDHLSINTPSILTNTWMKVQIEALDQNGNRVTSPSFSGRLYVVTEFGEAIVRPTELTPLDFVNGVASIQVLSRSNKTLFIATKGAFNAVSGPMVHER